jgi:hypothetical protein
MSAPNDNVDPNQPPKPDPPPGFAKSAPLSAELLEWARQQFDEEETTAGIREIRETGGLALDEFFDGLQEAAIPRESKQ